MRIFISLCLIALSLFSKEPNFGKYDGSAVILDLNSSKQTVLVYMLMND